MEEKIDLDIVIMPEGGKNPKLYSIYSIQVPNIVTQGKTIEEAKKMLIEALNLYFEDMPGEKEKLICTDEKECTAPLISRILL
jgi:predicted RNase H-like HicB family nuclease